MNPIHKVFFIENMTKQDEIKIKSLLENDTRVNFSISSSTQSISIKGTNDEIFTTKQLLKSEGYSVL